MKECPACNHCFPDKFNNCPTDGEQLILSIRGDPVLDSRYLLDQRLGQGGMGIVYKAQHIFLKTSYAIKVILPDLVGNDPMLATRFRQEAMVAARIRHRNIVNVTDFGVVNGMPYLVMDFIQGRSLHDLLSEEGRLSAARTLEIVNAVCAGVGAAHRQGVVHRDLKPLNIMIQDGVPFSEGVRVLDFGLAKIKSGELLGSFVAAQSTGLMGSPYYMAPELWSDEEPDKAADIYSLGVIVFQILTNELPFRGPSIPSIMKKHLTDSPPRFASLGLNLPPGIEAAVRHALAKKPADRPASVEMFLGELRDGVATASGRMVRTASDVPADTGALTIRYPKKSATASSIGETSWEQTITNSQRNLADEADRLALEFEEAQRRADEARKRAEEAALRRAEEEAERRRAEEEAADKRAEEEAARKRAEEALQRQAEEEAARQRAEEEAAQKRAAAQARKIAEEEAERQRVIEEAKRLAREVTEAQEREADARLRADEEADKRTEETAARLRAEDEVRRLGLEVAEAQRRAEEARQRAESEALKRAEEAKARKQAEERAARKVTEEAARKQEAEELGRKRAADEADRLAGEVAEAQNRAAEAGQRADAEARKRAEEEEARKRAEAEARRLEQEMAELQRRAEEARQRAEADSRKRAAEEEARKQAEEEARREAEAKREAEKAATVAEPAEKLPPVLVSPNATLSLSKTLPTQPIPDPAASWGHSQPSIEHPAIGVGVGKLNKPAVWMVSGIIFLFLILIGGGVALYSLKSWSASKAQPPALNQATPSPANVAPTPNLAKIEGGTFQMGRSDVSLDSKNTYDLSQYPARPVTVKTFWMDKTELTNAEYQYFVRESKHSLPSYWRDGKPPAGQEQWPVTGVSLDDAMAFAQWRSNRDHVKYRLPNEDEWEYAARNGSQATLYPWGNQWLDDRANVDTNSLKPVGSHPQGASSRWGLLDLIGNAWEWTSTPAAPYPGNSTLSIPPAQFIIRGGAFSDRATGPKAITATRRSWLAHSDKDPAVGFRLVRDGS